MRNLKMVLGNKNYSSWSLRPWLVLKQIGVPFEEKVIALDQPDTAKEIAKYTPAGRVPVLMDGDRLVWDSLAICEYLNDAFPEKMLWPSEATARASARSLSAEMHSGFQAMREQLPMKFRESIRLPSLRPDVKRDVDRVLRIWSDCRERFGKSGPFLFGAFSIADAMYAPVVSRFKTYGVSMDGSPAAYAETIWKLPSMQEWLAAARAENYRMARYEAQPTP
jgi:glutathione S-transferase